jgi:diguanylate cyclase (GGDEF)-like protein
VSGLRWACLGRGWQSQPKRSLSATSVALIAVYAKTQETTILFAPIVLDPLPAFIFVTIFALLNGAVLGFMHGELTADVQPSAADWRIATLLVAGCSVLFVAQSAAQSVAMAPISNGFALVGLALYWRAMRRFFGEADTLWIFTPAVLGVTGIAAFSFVWPSLAHRIGVATVCWVALLSGSAWTLLRHHRAERSANSTVLSVIFVSLALLMLLRGALFVFRPATATSIIDPTHWVNLLTPLSIGVLPVIGTTAFVLLCFERIRRRLHVMASTDALTGLPNRLTINERAAEWFAQARAASQSFSVAIVDIDHFKGVNDNYGHEVGDAVLKVVARTLVSTFSRPVWVGRLGGEEFVALLRDQDLDAAQRTAEDLRQAVERCHPVHGGQSLSVTVSIGVATLVPSDANFGALLRRADRALYAAKAAGRNCARVS